jgi:hypothetical protein
VLALAIDAEEVVVLVPVLVAEDEPVPVFALTAALVLVFVPAVVAFVVDVPVLAFAPLVLPPLSLLFYYHRLEISYHHQH